MAMIEEMVKDLIFFISLIAILVCSFGIITQATLHPNSTLSMNLIKSIINKGYWPIYGEMKIFQEFETEDCSNNNHNECSESTGVVFSFIALMIYMLIANVLLIDLLIAMFR